MKHTMQDTPLTLALLFRRAERLFGHKRIQVAGPTSVETTTYSEWATGTRKLIGVLDALQVPLGARVATFSWNNRDHLALSFAVPGSGRVFHALNFRLTDEQLSFVVNDAEDDVIFVDRSLLPRLAPQLPTFKSVRHVVVVDDVPATELDIPSIPEHITVSEMADLCATAVEVDPCVNDENAAAAICYTSGTTGNPKGVVYSHRAMWLHAMALLQVDTTGINERDAVLLLVPFFHANAWGLGYAAVAAGSDLVLPGRDLSGPVIAELIEVCGVTISTAVPAVWSRILPELRGRDVSSLRMLCSGGSAVPARLTELCRSLTGQPIMQVWGMTEMISFASMARTRPHNDSGSAVESAKIASSQGIPVPGVEFRIVKEGTEDELLWDGVAAGELQCRGPWVTARYHGEGETTIAATDDGWFHTGDSASIDPDGYVRLRDRLKDLIKSGGEWIPSAELEVVLLKHPSVTAAAVIGVPSLRWDERPVACITIADDEGAVDQSVLLDWLRPQVAKLWLPDEILVLPELPVTSVGKIDKKALRARFATTERP
ncbi:long-chain-fatty-acid--CoA ligase [Rhodococcus erythropolis]